MRAIGSCMQSYASIWRSASRVSTRGSRFWSIVSVAFVVFRLCDARTEAGQFWVDADGRITPNTRDALFLIDHAVDDGLNPADYEGRALVSLVALVDRGAATRRDIAEVEDALPRSLLCYLRHLHHGRVDPRTVDFGFDTAADEQEWNVLLSGALTEQRVRDFAVKLRPPFVQYALPRAPHKLFAKSRRDFSHGCIRVADPITLAEWVLRDESGCTRRAIVAATNEPKTLKIALTRPVQVILFYTTAAVMPEDGTIRFADDIYHHGARLERALEQVGERHGTDH